MQNGATTTSPSGGAFVDTSGIRAGFNAKYGAGFQNWAQQNGYSQDEINNYINGQWNNFRNQALINQAAQQKAQAAQNQSQDQSQGNGNWLTGLLPTIGGAVGSIGAGLLGIESGPGAIAAAAAGGSAGSAAGKWIENLIEGNKDQGSGVGQEAAMGALAGLPLGSVAKLGQAGFKAATGLGKTSIGDLLTQAGEKTLPASARTAAQGAADNGALNATGNAAQAATDSLGNPLQPTLGQRIGNALSGTANDQLAKNQLSLTRANVRQIGGFDPAQLLGQMRQDYGLTNLDDINTLGQFATGKAGLDNGGAILTNTIENAARSGQGIDMSDLNTLVKPVLGQLDTKDATKLTNALDQAKETAGSATTAQGGASPTLSDPVGALKAARDLQTQAFQIRNAPSATVSELKRADAMSTVSNELKNRVYNGQQSLDTASGGTMSQDAQAAVNDGVAQLRAEAQKYQAAGNTKMATAINTLADKTQAAPDLKTLDTLQSPFVKASQMAQMSNLGQGGAAMDVGNLKNTLTGMLNSTAGDIARPSMNALLGKVGDLGDRLAGTTGNAAGSAASAGGPTIQSAIGRGGLERAVLGGSALGATNPQGPNATAGSPTDQNGLTAQDYQNLGLTPPTGGQGDTSQSQDQSGAFGGVTPSQIQDAMVQAVQSGDTKALANLKTIYDAMQSTAKADQSGTKLTSAQTQDIQNIRYANSYLDSLEQNLGNLAQGPVSGQAANVPLIGQLLDNQGAAYNATKIDVATALAKALVGSKPSQQTINFYMHSLPSTTDTQAQAQAKITNIRNELNNKSPVAASYPSGGQDLSSLLSSMGATQ